MGFDIATNKSDGYTGFEAAQLEEAEQVVRPGQLVRVARVGRQVEGRVKARGVVVEDARVQVGE